MTDEEVAGTDPDLADNEEVALQQISQLWYNNFGDVDAGDDMDADEMQGLFMEVAEILNEHGVDDPDTRQELVLDGIREAMDMIRERTVSSIEEQLDMYRHLFGI